MTTRKRPHPGPGEGGATNLVQWILDRGEHSRRHSSEIQQRNRMGFIDAHVHVWTDDTAHYPLAAGFKREDMRPGRFTPEDLFKHCKPAGVDRINLIQMSFYGFDNRLTI